MTERLEAIRLENMKELGFGIERMKELKVCTACGKASPHNEAFCRECGTELPQKTLYDIYKERHTVCLHCDTVVARGSEFCPQCGAKIKRNINNDEIKEETK